MKSTSYKPTAYCANCLAKLLVPQTSGHLFFLWALNGSSFRNVETLWTLGANLLAVSELALKK